VPAPRKRAVRCGCGRGVGSGGDEPREAWCEGVCRSWLVELVVVGRGMCWDCMGSKQRGCAYTRRRCFFFWSWVGVRVWRCRCDVSCDGGSHALNAKWTGPAAFVNGEVRCERLRGARKLPMLMRACSKREAKSTLALIIRAVEQSPLATRSRRLDDEGDLLLVLSATLGGRLTLRRPHNRRRANRAKRVSAGVLVYSAKHCRL
jgi:hypothetical protein